jgi:pre-mRNA cleavage complex 2 protein Pcf11
MHFLPPQQQATPMSSLDLADLKAEITQLISGTQARFAANYTDVALRKTLEALLGLKHILDTQTLPPQQLDAVRKQIQALAPPPTPTQTFSPALPAGFPPSIYPPPTPTNGYPSQQSIPPSFPPQFPPAGTPSGSAPPNVAQLLASFRPPVQHTPQPAPTPPPITPSLAELLKRVTSPTQSSTISAPAPFQPPPFQFPPAMSTPMPIPPAATPVPSATPTANLAALLAQFNKPGAVPPASHPTPVHGTPAPQSLPQPATAPPMLGSAEWLLKALSGTQGMPINGAPMASQPMGRQMSGPTSIKEQIELTTASMKQPRYHLISRLYEAKPNICATCARRFDTTPEGKEKKARHMDWHFKVKDPDASKRGVHRSWYIGEKEWIEYTEVDETAPPNESAATTAANKPKKQAKDRYTRRVPSARKSSRPCGMSMLMTSSGWTHCKLVARFTMQLVSRSIVRVPVYPCPARLIRCLGSGKQISEATLRERRFAHFERKSI